MIQISKMNQYWTKAIFVLFLLKPSLSFAEGSDPFDDTILTFEDKIESTEPIKSIESTAYQETTNQSETSTAENQPINKRYPITRYSMQGIIKSQEKTQMMFVATDENVKFFIGMNDCLGAECAYVTHIDKKGRATFEDDFGIYRFQVGQAPYIVEQKGLIAQDGIISTDAAQQIADGTCIGNQAYIGNIPEEIGNLTQLTELYLPEISILPFLRLFSTSSISYFIFSMTSTCLFLSYLVIFLILRVK